MQRRWSFNSRSIWALISAPVLAMTALSVAAAGPAQAHSAPAGVHILTPNKINNLDCNGWSRAYQSVAPAHRQLCADPHGSLRMVYSAATGTSRAVHPQSVHRGAESQVQRARLQRVE